MPNMKTKTNNNLLTQKIENIKQMEYSDQTVKRIAIVIGELRNIQLKKEQGFHKGILCIKDLKCLDEKGVIHRQRI